MNEKCSHEGVLMFESQKQYEVFGKTVVVRVYRCVWCEEKKEELLEVPEVPGVMRGPN